MRIAFISLMNGLPFGGSEILWTKTAELAINQGHKVLISVYDWGEETHHVFFELKANGAYLSFRERFSHQMSIPKKIKNVLINRLPKLKKHWREVFRFKPDHILINQGSNFDMLEHHFDLYQLIEKHKVPYSILSHSHVQYSFIPDLNIFPNGKEIFMKAKNTFFISKTQQKVTEKALCISLTNARITWNPLNLIEPRYIEWPLNDTVQFAMVGSLISGKGHDIALEVFTGEMWQSRDWQLNLYGTGYGENYLKELVRTYRLQKRVNFRGFAKSAADIWKHNHVLLIPSSGEGMPISMMEALISGRPVIATDVGGIREIIREDVNGYLAEAPSVFSFAKAIEKAWQLKNKWKEIGIESSTIYNIPYKPEMKLLNYLID